MEYTVKQVAERLKVSADMVQRWIKSGALKARKKNPLAVAANSPYLIDEKDLKQLEKKLGK